MAVVATDDPRLRQTFIGRRAELDVVKRAARDAQRRKVAVAVEIVGDPGAGKSAFAERAIQDLVRAGLEPRLVLRGRCEEVDRQPLGLFRAMAEGLRRAAGGDDESDLVDALSDWCTDGAVLRRLVQARRGIEQLLSGDAGQSESAESVMMSVQSGLCGLLTAVSQAGTGPVVVVLDDVQWVDDVSARIGAAVFSSMTGTRGLLALMIRRKGAAIAGRWRSRLQLERVDIEPLDLVDTRSLVIGLLGDGVARRLAKSIAELASGNPFMAEQVASLMIDRGAVIPATNGWAARGDFDPGDVPDSVEGVVAERVACLGADTRLVLAACALIGDVVERQVLDRTLDGGQRTLQIRDRAVLSTAPHVARLVARGLLVCTSDPRDRRHDRLSFRHRIVKNAAVESLAAKDRAAFHTAAATALARRYEDALNPWFGAIAGHYDAAGDKTEALTWRMRAGRYAMAVGSLDEARRDLERAVTLAVDSGSTRTLASALCALAEVQLSRGDCDEAGETCDRGLKAQPDTPTAARLLYVQARALTELQKADRAQEVADLAQVRAPADDAELRGRLCLLRARLRRYALDIDGAYERLAEAETLVADVEDDTLRIDVWVERAYAAAQRADEAVVARMYARLTDALSTDNIAARGAALTAVGLLACSYFGDMPAAARAYDEAARLHNDAGELARYFDAQIGVLMTRCYLGRLHEGERMRRGLIALAEAVDVPRHAINMDLILATHSFHRGELKRALKEIRRGLGRIDRLDVPLARADREMFAYIEGQIRFELGEHEQGQRLVEDAVTSWHQAGKLLLFRHEADLVLADMFIARGDPKGAHVALQRAESALQRIPSRYYRAWAASSRAAVATLWGDLDDAVECAVRAEHFAVSGGSDYQRVRAMTEHGAALLAAGREQCLVVLEEAAGLADRCGATGLRRRIAKLATRAQSWG